MKTKGRKMERTAVDSSNVAEVGYDEDAMVLEVEFHGGKVYQYHGVPADVHAELMASGSVGSFLSTRIKGQYRCERVE
jgi:hypothetical protein